MISNHTMARSLCFLSLGKPVGQNLCSPSVPVKLLNKFPLGIAIHRITTELKPFRFWIEPNRPILSETRRVE
jgi:hypothetical protein